MMTIGSLFSGIGGFELGLLRAGLGPVVWQCERDPDCRIVLARHFPDATRYDDARTCHPTPVDVLCGGFPCQDLSMANVRRSDRGSAELWGAFDRVVAETTPQWVIVENSAQWQRWVPVVRRDLWSRGYASVPFLLCPSWLGAPHRRPRVFVVAHSDREGKSLCAVDDEVARLCSVPAAHWHRRNAPPGGFRLADGLPGAVGECRRYGNAVVPQVVEVIGRAIGVAA